MSKPHKYIEATTNNLSTEMINPDYVKWLEDQVKEQKAFIYDLQKAFFKIHRKHSQIDFLIKEPDKPKQPQTKRKHRPDLYDAILIRLVKEHRRIWKSALKPFLPSGFLKNRMIQALQTVGETECAKAIRGQHQEAIKPESKRGRELKHVFKPVYKNGTEQSDQLDKDALALFINACPKSTASEMTKFENKPRQNISQETKDALKKAFHGGQNDKGNNDVRS